MTVSSKKKQVPQWPQWLLIPRKDHFLTLFSTFQGTSAMLLPLIACLSCPKALPSLGHQLPIRELWQITQISWTLTLCTVSRYNKWRLTYYKKAFDNVLHEQEKMCCLSYISIQANNYLGFFFFIKKKSSVVEYFFVPCRKMRQSRWAEKWQQSCRAPVSLQISSSSHRTNQSPAHRRHHRYHLLLWLVYLVSLKS